MAERSERRMADRTVWLDVARGYGIGLVFYGHLLEPFADARWPGAFAGFQFVYAFHMPLFFLLAGTLARTPASFGEALRKGLASRIVPAIFFNLFMMAFWLPPSPLHAALSEGALTDGLVRIVQGRPSFNFLTWFLYCLFVVELLHAGLRRIANTEVAMAGSVVVLLVAGLWVAEHAAPLTRALGLPNHAWSLDEALVAAAFHQAGFLGSRLATRRGFAPGRAELACLGLGALGVLWMSYDANPGPFSWHKPVVAMSMASHGAAVPFVGAAAAGIVAVLALAQLTPGNTVAAWLGRYSLPLFGLNAFWINFVNPAGPVLAASAQGWGGPALWGLGVAAAAVSLALTAPVAWALTRALPQLVGRPREAGPLLPPLLHAAPRNPHGEGG